MTIRSSLLAATSATSLALASGAAAQAPATKNPPRVEEPAAEEEPSGPPTAGQAATPASDAEAAADEIVVTGFRSSLEKGLNLKKEAITLRDSIVAEDIGKFPESNVADALQRIPGVELVRDGNSNEGQNIQLRGLGSQFTVTTFNGSPVYTTSAGGIGNASRSFNYDIFPSELFGRADVYKAPLAELTEGGIAGVVDLQTPRPFDRRGRQIRYSVSANHNSQTGFISPRGHVLLSNTWGNFGLLISAAGANTKNGRTGFESTGSYSGAAGSDYFGSAFGNNFDYNFTAPNVNLNGNTEQQIRDAFVPRTFIVAAQANMRKRRGVSGSIQFKNDRLDLSLDGLWSQLKDDNERKDVRWPIRDSTGANRLVPLNVTVDENNNLQGTLGNVQFFYNAAFSVAETQYKYLALNAAYELTDRLRVSGQIAGSDSHAWRSDASFSGDARQLKHEITFDTSDPVYPVLTTNKNLLDPAIYVTNGGLGYGGGYRTEDDKLGSGRIVADYEYGLGGMEGHLKLGYSRNRNTKQLEVRADNTIFNNLTIPGVGLYSAATVAQRNAFTTSFLQPLEINDFVPGASSTLPKAFLTYDKQFAYGFLDTMAFNRNGSLNFGSTYKAVETIDAFFVQTDLTLDLFGRRLRSNVGARYVSTKTDIDNNKLAAGGTFVPDNVKGSYDKWLPSATLAYDLREDLIVRAAVGKTLTRSAIQQIAASISLPAGGAGNLILNRGNPDLQPEFATSLDAAIEWYFAPGGIISVAGFKKTLKGRAATFSVFEPFNTLGIPASIFTPNIQAELAANPATPVEVRTPTNLDKYHLKGIEVQYQQAFSFLPKPFDGLGALASFTYVKTQGLTRPLGGQIRNGAVVVPVIDFALNDVPEYTYSVAGYYEKGPVTFRLSYNHKTEVANIGQTSGNIIGFQRFANARGYLDATASYRFRPWLEFRVDAANILNTQTYDFFRRADGKFGDENSRVELAYQNGRVVTFGIRGKF